MTCLRWSESAQHGLLAVHDRIAGIDDAAALRLKERILSTVSRLADHPTMGRPGRLRGTREVDVEPTLYVVAYRNIGETVEVLSLLHDYRPWPRRA
ncbi:MAG: type II toxin-antitoxin system RelE/ParE family toxin [Alphaproteobacteria bacterium]